MGAKLSPKAKAQTQAESNGSSLVGTWLFQITLESCATKAPVGEPFYSLLTFDAGGAMTETTSNAMFYPDERGPAHGVWSHVGSSTYKATQLAFITQDGVLQKLQTVEQTIKLKDNNALKTTSANVVFTAPDGTVLMQGCASATGQRLGLSGLK